MLNKFKNKIKTLVNHEGVQRYAANTSWLLAEKVLRLIVGLVVTVWIARYLGPEDFGLFNYAQSFVGLFAGIASLGLDGVVIKELVRDKSRQEEIIGTSFWLKIIGACVVLMVLALSVKLTSNDNYTNLLIFIIASANVFHSFNVADLYFQSKVLSRYVVFSKTISLFFSSVLKIGLILFEAPLIAFAWVIVFDSLILALALIFFFIGRSPAVNVKNLKMRSQTAANLLRESWPLILSGVVVSLYMKVDQVMIKEILDSEAVGHYAAAVRLSEVWYFVPAVISSSLFPAIINAKNKSESIYYERLQRLYSLMFVISITIAIPVTFLSHWLVGVLYGAEYKEAGSVLLIHIWACVFVFLGTPTSKWFLLEGMQRYSLYRAMFAIAVNVVFNLILIPIYGVVGAALATLFSSMLASYFFNGVFRATRLNFIMQTKSIFLPFYYVRGFF